jgi:putative inorganic carbon (HCO3(-)) transporter
MEKFFNKAVAYLFYALFFLVPFVLFPKSSELFEFNKMVLTYSLCVLIISFWIGKMLIQGKVIFRRTIFDIPLLIFLITQAVATIISIDPHTSLFGYYSRFNGGFLSTLTYSFLYWAYVSNMDKGKTKKTLIFLLTSSLIVSIYAVLEHFGIDKNVWVQDVQNRVFSTLGQPNWLASWLIALTPLTWVSLIITKSSKKYFWIFLSSLLFLVLLYTKSRSGLLGFVAADVIFGLGAILIYSRNKSRIIKLLGGLNVIFLILVLVTGTPWTPSINELVTKTKTPVETPSAPLLEVGGTESAEIRKIVWKGAFDIWKNNPLIGTGLETFAYSYYNYRPVEHNMISEWDFLYNKAHNEYLNYLATTGVIGTASYLLLIAAIIYILTKIPLKNIKMALQSQKYQPAKRTTSTWHLALFSGFSSILITNFFGFSVVTVSTLFFLYPAFAVTLKYNESKGEGSKKLNIIQIALLPLLFGLTFYALFLIGKYWYADYLYAEGKALNNQEKYANARVVLFKATNLISTQAEYFDELSQSAANLAVNAYTSDDLESAKLFAETAITESQQAVDLSPNNLNIRRNRAALFIKLSALDPKLLEKASEEIEKAISLAPTDAKLYFNLGLTYARTDRVNDAVEVLKKTIDLKPNYRDARLALALIYINQKKFDLARNELEYILKFINPQDGLVIQQLQEIK